MSQLVLCLESDRAEAEVLAVMHFFPEALGMNLFPSSFRCWQNSGPCFCRTDVPVSLPAVKQGQCLGSKGHPHPLPCGPLPPCSEQAVAGGVLLTLPISLNHFCPMSSHLTLPLHLSYLHFCLPLLMQRAQDITLDPPDNPE